jgi:hypothetical protein
MAGAKEKDAQISPGGLRHPGSRFQQFHALTHQDAGLELADRLEVIVESSVGN